MRPFAATLASLLLVSASATAGTQDPEPARDLPAYVVRDDAAPEVTLANLIASERFWPYQAALVRPWTPPASARAIPAGTLGVVIRALPGARVRIDFGRDGLFTLPVVETDLLRRANEIRTGALAKTAPNLTYAIAPRLLDAESESPRRVRLEHSFDDAGQLCLFADPSDARFPRFAAALAPLAGRSGVSLVLFPQGEHPDIALHPKLREAGWRGAFALDHLSEAYTRTLVDGPIDTPRLALFSAEGRMLWTGPFDGAIPPALERAYAEGFPTPR